MAVLFGGRSAEHEVSVQSAKNVFRAIDRGKYQVIPIFIDRGGRWLLRESETPIGADAGASGSAVALAAGENGPLLVSLTGNRPPESVDVVFPVLHGSFGEDGAIQGTLRSANAPFVGASVLGSAIAMDKEVTKRLLRQAGLPAVELSRLVGRRFGKRVLKRRAKDSDRRCSSNPRIWVPRSEWLK